MVDTCSRYQESNCGQKNIGKVVGIGEHLWHKLMTHSQVLFH